jgi:diguanylate cyclase (GGDEF)-like protein
VWPGDTPAVSLSTSSLSSPSITRSSVLPPLRGRGPATHPDLSLELWLERTAKRPAEDPPPPAAPAVPEARATPRPAAPPDEPAPAAPAKAATSDVTSDVTSAASVATTTTSAPASTAPASTAPASTAPASASPRATAAPTTPRLEAALGQWYGRRGRRRGSRVRGEVARGPVERILWLLTVVQATCVGVFTLTIPAQSSQNWPYSLNDLLTAVTVLATTGMCLRAAVRERRRRGMFLAWSLLTAAHLGASASPDRLMGPFTDHGATGLRVAVALTYFPLALAALWLLLRDVMPRWLPSMWGDAVVVGLGALAAGTFAANLLRPGATLTSHRSQLTYASPLVDVVLLAMILSVAALTGCRVARQTWWVSSGLTLVAVGDLGHLLILHGGGVEHSGSVDLGWLVGYVLIGTGARRGAWPVWGAGRRERRPRTRTALHLGVLPWAFCAIAAGVLAAQAFDVAVPRYSAVLALGTLCAALLRVGLTLAELDGGTIPPGAARTDELTGLANRRALSEALASDGAAAGDGTAVQRWSGWTDRIALLLVDLDSFKDINEALGHEVGDQVLAEVGSRLRAALRSPQLIARLGGDEFAVVLPGAGRESATRVAESLCAVLAEPVEIDGHRLHVRVSVGVATCLIPHEEPEDLLRQADVALNRAKAVGTVLEVYDPALDLRTAHRLMRIDELRSALERGDLEVYLQPQVDLVDGAVVGAEALARWRHPQDGVLLPDSFLPLAAQTGLMRPVAALVLDRALGACARWWRRGHRIPVSVNLTADDLRDTGMSRRISDCLAQHGLPAQALRIEITEDVLLTDPEAAGQLLQSWRRAGIAVAVDDFGTGYSSLGYLRELPFDELKLDRSFVADLRRRTTATIVRHTISMAHGLGMRVVAEGVEDQATARALADVGCDIGQGLYFGAAMALPAFLEQLEASQP